MTTRVVDIVLPAGLLADRPAATAVPAGALYPATDSAIVYRSDGATWATWATFGSSGGAGGFTREVYTVPASTTYPVSATPVTAPTRIRKSIAVAAGESVTIIIPLSMLQSANNTITWSLRRDGVEITKWLDTTNSGGFDKARTLSWLDVTPGAATFEYELYAHASGSGTLTVKSPGSQLVLVADA